MRHSSLAGKGQAKVGGPDEVGNLSGPKDAVHGVRLHSSNDRLRPTAKCAPGLPRYEILQEVDVVDRSLGLCHVAERRQASEEGRTEQVPTVPLNLISDH